MVLEEIRPEAINEINQETFDVRTVMVLVRHYHYRAIAKSKQIFFI